MILPDSSRRRRLAMLEVGRHQYIPTEAVHVGEPLFAAGINIQIKSQSS